MAGLSGPAVLFSDIKLSQYSGFFRPFLGPKVLFELEGGRIVLEGERVPFP
jgi:hypothetical protein